LERKVFFFEKKKQKTFAGLSRSRPKLVVTGPVGHHEHISVITGMFNFDVC